MQSMFTSLENLKPDLSSPEEKPSTLSYVLCNEQNQRETLSSLASDISGEEREKSLHIGFSVWFNLDIIAITKPDCALVFDIDPKVHFVYQAIKEACRTANTPEEFIPAFMEKMEQYFDLAIERDFLQTQLVEMCTSRGLGFLASEAGFNAVKQRISSNQVFFGQADITDSTQIRQISHWAKEQGLAIDTLYTSNIPEWIHEYSNRDTQDRLIENLKLLINPNTRVIDAFYPTNIKKGSGLPQRISSGELPDFKKTREKRKREDSRQFPFSGNHLATLFARIPKGSQTAEGPRDNRGVKRRRFDSESVSSGELQEKKSSQPGKHLTIM